MSAGSGADGQDPLAGAVLHHLAETDVYASRLQGARTIRERMQAKRPDSELPAEHTFEAALQAMTAAGLVEMAYEPYIPPRYLITPAGRARAASHRSPTAARPAPACASGSAAADAPPYRPGR